jgi:hypothetical protein
MIDVISGAHNYAKAANGDEFYMVTIVYKTNKCFEEQRMDTSESLDLRFFHVDQFPKRMVQSHQRILRKYVKTSSQP